MTATRRSGSGPPPTPTRLKLLHGNPGHQKINRAEPQPKSSLAPPPASLTADAKRIWRRDGKRLLALGVMTEIDEGAFAAYCQSYATWLAVTAQISSEGVLVNDDKGILRANPLLRVAREAQLEFTRAAGDFGMTPASRSRIQVKAPASDDLEDFFARHPRGSDTSAS